jgi:hypothetical protein
MHGQFAEIQDIGLMLRSLIQKGSLIVQLITKVRIFNLYHLVLEEERANLEITLANLLFHFNWNMPNEDKANELDMTESFGLTVRRKHDLWLVPTIYQSS